MELESLSFRVDSSQLKEAADKIAALAAAIAALEAVQKSETQVAKESAKAERQRIKDAAELEKLKAKLLAAETAAANATNGTTQANSKAEKQANSLANLMSRLTGLYGDLSNGSSKWESSILQTARTLGASADQMNQVRNSLQQINTLTRNPFDSAIGAAKSIQREMQALSDRASLAAQGISLTTKQLQEYSRIGAEIRGQMTSQGIDHTTPAGLIQFNAELKKQQDSYLLIAGEINRVTAEEKKRNDVLNAQRNIMAELEQKNKSIQESINRNTAMTSSMQGGMTQANAGTQYDNSRLLAGATTPEQLTRIQERITLTQKLTESERLLNVEQEKQNALLKHIEGIVAQQKAIDDLNKSIIANVAERKKMDDLMQKYSAMGLNSANSRELGQAELRGASQASIDSLKNYLLGVQQVTKAKEDQKKIDDDLNAANQRAAREAAATRYSGLGHSSVISNTAAGMEIKGVPAAAIQSYIQDATAKEQSNKATRELNAAKKYLIETEERLAAAVNSANQNLNRQATDELVKYQNALRLVGTSADEAERKLHAFKAQQEIVAAKAREQQLNHLSRGISTQMGDVGISLASGMNPLTVALQQGDQIRGLLVQAGAEGAELQKAMNAAAAQIASSIAITFKAMSGFITGIVTTSGKALASLVTGPLQFVKDYRAANAALAASSITLAERNELMKQSWEMMGKAMAGLGKTVIGLAAVMTTVLLVAYVQIIKREQALSKAITESGAALGYSKDSAVAFATSLNGITTNTAIEAITDFAKAGVRGTESTEKMLLAAIDLEKYGGAAIEASAAAYAKLQGEPMKALQDLAESSGRVTVATLEKAKAYKEAGDKAGLLSLAETEAVRVTEEKAQAMKASMSPIQELWIDVKHAVGGAWEEIQNLTKAGPIVSALDAVFQTVKFTVQSVWWMIKGVITGITGLVAIAGAAAKDVANLDTNFTSTKNMVEVVGYNPEIEAAARRKAEAKKIVEENKHTTTEQLKANTELAKSFGKASEAEEKYLDNINRMKRERNQLEGQYNKLKGQGKEGTASGKMLSGAMGNLDKRIKDAEESEAKKNKGPKAATSSFSGVASSVSLVDNTPNIQREYSSELGKTQKFIRSQRDILKLSFEAGLVSRGEYIAKDIALITSGQSNELNVISDFSKRIEAENKKMTEAVEARRSDALAATRDPKSIERINLAADDEIKKLRESIKTFRELQSDKTDTIAFEADKRYYESLKEQNAAMLESKKHLEDLNKTMQDAAEIRALEAQSQWDTMYIAGDELASYKARNDALKDYVKLQSKLKADLAGAERLQDDFLKNTVFDGQNQEGIEKAVQMQRQVELLKSQIVKAGIDAETAARIAGIDAVNKYYMDKAMEVRDGTANAITEGIINGGKAGSDAIKNVLNNLLRDMLNNVFKSLLGSIGNEITKAITSGGQKQQSSGGGFLEGLFSRGLKALAGGLGGGSGGLVNPVGDTGGFSNAFGLRRATGGFVNQGSEYMVGENGPEKFIPNQSGSIVPNHDLGKSKSSDPLKVTIINNTSAPIGKVTERQISPTERALVIEEAVNAVAASMHDPNHKVSKSLGQNYKMQRNR